MIHSRAFSISTLTAMLLAAVATATPQEPTTLLTVKSNPDNATVIINHKMRETTPLTVTDLPPQRCLIQVVKEGFDEVFETVNLEAGVHAELNLDLEPVSGLLLIASYPSGAEVSREGVALGSTPLLVTSLPQGTHRLTLALPGYQSKEIDVQLDGRTPQRETVELMADSGTVNVKSEPVGAEVLVNGIARGTTPCTIERIPGGSVTLELQHPGYLSHTREISLAAGEVQKIDVIMQPMPGTLKVVSLPESARFYLNNEFKGETPLTLDNLKPGDYRVRVEKDGHTPMARDLTIARGSSATEEFRMEKNTGTLTILTAPAGCTIMIDGRKAGITSAEQGESSAVSDPLSIKDVPSGARTVEIIRKGFKPEKRKLTVIQDQTATLQIKLTRQFIPNYEITTLRSYHKGVLEFANDAEIRIETAPGVTTSIPMKDVIKHGVLKEE